MQVVPPGGLQLPRRPDGTGIEECFFSLDRVVRADSPLAHRDIRRLVTPVIERYCQVRANLSMHDAPSVTAPWLSR